MSNLYKNLEYSDSELMDTEPFVNWLNDNGENCSTSLLKVDLDTEKFQKLLASSQKLRLTPSSDGLIGLVKDNEKNTDLSRSSQKFVMHTDGPYYENPPELVILNCIEASESGNSIPTILRDTKTLIESFSEDEIEILKNVDFYYHGKDNKKFPRSLLEKLRNSEDLISNFGGKGHVECHSELKYDFYTWFSVCDKFFKKIYSSEEPLIELDYKKYDTLVFNNHRYLHGRENKKSVVDTKRTLNRIWIDFQ